MLYNIFNYFRSCFVSINKMKKEIKPDWIIGLIDTDHSYNAIGPEKYNRDFLENMFYGMHDNSHDLFMSIVSEEGKKKWK